MSHVRQQIRDYIFGLVDNLATTGANAFKTRVYPFPTANLPGLCVKTSDEVIDPELGEIGPGSAQERVVEMIVEGYDKLVSGVDDSLDTIAAEVETAIYAQPTLGGLCKSCLVTNIEVDPSETVEKPAGSITLTFQVHYMTIQGAPETAI